MLSGFNTNFRHRGVLFHVQTEDSGRDNPHVITHLFHGGNIMVSVKQDYSHLLVKDEIEGAVKKLMEAQHKKILKQLSQGKHDGTITERLGPEIFKKQEAAPAAEAAPKQKKRPSPEPETTEAMSTVFGDRVVSEKPLDEVVLDYLVENARKRKRPRK